MGTEGDLEPSGAGRRGRNQLGVCGLWAICPQGHLAKSRDIFGPQSWEDRVH